jgi:hypothetical protein
LLRLSVVRRRIFFALILIVRQGIFSVIASAAKQSQARQNSHLFRLPRRLRAPRNDVIMSWRAGLLTRI